MKNILKITVAATLLFITTISMANGPRIQLLSGNEGKSVVLAMNSQSSETNITLIDNKSRTFIDVSISDASYTKQFNLKDLEDGTYYFKVENLLQSVVYTLNIDQKEVNIVNRNDRTTKPIFRKEGKKVYINLFNANQENVVIKIMDTSNRVVFRELVKDELIIGKAFSFENAFDGKYTIVVKNGKDKYYENIVKG